MTEPITLDLLTKYLKQGVVKFSYLKSNGKEREAFGTLNSSVIEDYAAPSGRNRRGGPSSTFSYFDIEKLAWRCFIPENLIGIDPDYALL